MPWRNELRSPENMCQPCQELCKVGVLLTLLVHVQRDRKKRSKWIEYCLIGEVEMLIYNLDAARRLPVYFHNTLSQHLEALRLYFTESHLEISSHK